MADFLRNIYEVPDEYTRAQALEQQEYARRQRQLFDPRAMVEAARNPMARGIVMPIIWNPQVGPDWFSKSGFLSALESVKRTTMATEEALGRTLSAVRSINTKGVKELEDLVKRYEDKINEIRGSIESKEDPLDRHFFRGEAMMELSRFFDEDVVPSLKRYFEMEADLEEQLRTGAVKDKTSGTKGYFGTTFNPNDYSIVHNLTDNDKQNLAYANVSAWSNNGFSNYNATDLGFTSTVSSIAFGDVNDLFKNIYESVHDKNPNIREWVQQDSELKPINFISKHENVMRDAYNALVLVPTALTKLIRERLGNDVNVKDVVDKLKSNLESCASGQGNPEACANALLIDYNGQKIDFSPVLNVFKDAYATARPIETLLTSLRLSEDATIGGIPESYSGNPIKAYFATRELLREYIKDRFRQSLMEFKLDENEARNAQKREAIADAYADGVIRQFDQKVREAADMFNIRYDKQIEMPKEYGGGGGGGKKSTSTVPEVDTRVYHSINSVYDSLNQQENNTYPISIGFRANMALMSGSKGVLTEGHMINNFFVKIKDREGFKERFFPGVNDIPNWELPDNPNSAVNYNISWTPDFGIGVAQFDNTGDGHVNYKFMSGFGNIKSLYDTYIDDVNPSTITDDFAQLLRTINNPGLAADLELIPVSLDYSEAEGVMSDILNIEPGWFDDISDVSVALGGFTLNNFRLNPDGTVSFEMDPTSIELSTARYGDLDKGDPEHMAALNIARSIATNMAAFNKVSPDDIGVAALPAKDGSHFLIFIRYKDAKGAIKTYSALKIDKSIVDKYKPALSIDYNYLVNNAKDVVNSLYLEINDPISETVRTMKNSGISSQLLDKAKSIIEKWRKEFSDKEYSGKLTPEQEANFIKDMTKVMFYLPIRGQGGIMEKVSQIDLMLNRTYYQVEREKSKSDPNYSIDKFIEDVYNSHLDIRKISPMFSAISTLSTFGVSGMPVPIGPARLAMYHTAAERGMLQDVANAAGFNLDYSRVEGEYTLKLNRKVKEDINDQMSVTINNMGKMAITILPQSYLMGHKLNQETNQQNK